MTVKSNSTTKSSLIYAEMAYGNRLNWLVHEN